uniref:Uncharacterized protein n=1 Tax=Vespula pensylvanica TaxID=30213 RepID=A0A834U9I4_VESPE|nr:hypothetical protein H0235_008902 [Vespula pensylvanica]
MVGRDGRDERWCKEGVETGKRQDESAGNRESAIFPLGKCGRPSNARTGAKNVERSFFTPRVTLSGVLDTSPSFPQPLALGIAAPVSMDEKERVGGGLATR